MTLGERLMIALVGIAADQSYLGRAPDDQLPPYIVIPTHFGPISNTFTGKSELQNQRVQVTIYSETYLEAEAIADQVETAMGNGGGSPILFQSLCINRMSLEPDVVTKLYHTILEFSVWVTTP